MDLCLYIHWVLHSFFLFLGNEYTWRVGCWRQDIDWWRRVSSNWTLIHIVYQIHNVVTFFIKTHKKKKQWYQGKLCTIILSLSQSLLVLVELSKSCIYNNQNHFIQFLQGPIKFCSRHKILNINDLKCGPFSNFQLS